MTAIEFFTNPRIFNFVIMGLYLANTALHAYLGRWSGALYWLSAFGIVSAVTWGVDK